jgi:NB-ARC domain-containing protein/CHAT domain-containing protein
MFPEEVNDLLPGKMSEKIKILFLSANPLTTSWIRVDEEARQIREKLERGSKADQFDLLTYPATRAADLQELLMKHEPQIVHFSGHGSLAEKIILEDFEGNGVEISTKGLVDVFRLQRNSVRVVVLNACMTKPQAIALSQVIDYVVGIEKLVGDRAAVIFAGAFYLALSFGKSVEEAFKSARAELLLQKPARSRGLRIFVRKGVDRKVRFPPAPTAAIDKNGALAKALQDLIDNDASADVIRRVRRATLDGTLVLEQADEIIEGEASIFEASGAKRSGKALRARVHPVTYSAVQERLFPPPPGIGPPPPGLIVIGRENSLAHVGKLLTPPAKARSFKLTVVRGWPGVGKTTLVGVLGRDPKILKAFPEGVLWTALERKPELMTKMAEWGRVLGTNDLLRVPKVEEAVEKLAPLLRHRRMLLIVDDIWKAEHAVPFLTAAAGTSCSLLATTRLTEVAEALSQDPGRIYVLPELTEENSLNLLRYLAPDPVEQYPEECRQLVNALGNLPLALHVAGRLLKAEAKLGLSVVDLIKGIQEDAIILEESAPLDRTEGTVLPTVQALLKRSTDELDEYTRDCFAYLGPFAPKPATFDIAAMKAMWRIDDPLPVIRKLVGHGLLEPVGGRFQMHELLVKHANSLLK